MKQRTKPFKIAPAQQDENTVRRYITGVNVEVAIGDVIAAFERHAAHNAAMRHLLGTSIGPAIQQLKDEFHARARDFEFILVKEIKEVHRRIDALIKMQDEGMVDINRSITAIDQRVTATRRLVMQRRTVRKTRKRK